MAATFDFRKKKISDGNFLDNRLNKGADWTFDFTFTQRDTLGVKTPIDLTNVVDIRLQVRTESGSTIIAEANFANGFFSVTDAVNGISNMRIPGGTTAGVTVPDDGEALYDLELEFPGGVIMRKLEGVVEISENITE